jgi:WD40-like Beta Propeller Repeat
MLILRLMRHFFIFLFLSLSLALAQQEIIAPHVHVIYDEPILADYAQQVARDAEAALDILSQYFGEPKEAIAITINDNSDVFNAFGSPLPRPKVSVRALFTNDALLGFGAKDELFLLLIHELTHVRQLTYTEIPDAAFRGPQFGLVGQNTAQVPPMWFLEGIAVWIESEHTEGGRRDDALTQGLLDTLVLSENFPTLTDVSLSSYAAWPGGNARYLLGVSFLQHLIDSYGIEAILATLREYNAGFFLTTFAEAWQSVTGSSLFAEWDVWRDTLRVEAEQRTADLPEQNVLTATDFYTGTPALSPDGKKLAWISSPPKIVVADIVDGELKNERTVLDRRAPDTLEWQNDNTLLYSRIVRRQVRKHN